MDRPTRDVERLCGILGRHVTNAVRGRSPSSTRRSYDHYRQEPLAVSQETELLNESKLIQTLKRSVARRKPTPVPTEFYFNEERTIKDFAVALQDEFDKVLAAGLQNNYRMLKDAFRSSGRYTPRVDKDTPGYIQLLLELIDDYFRTRKQILADRPVEILPIVGPKETVPHDEFTVAAWMRLLALEEIRQPTLPQLETKVLHEMVRGSTENFPNASSRLVCVLRSQRVSGKHTIRSRNASTIESP